MTYAYIRVSTDMQTVENQKITISKYAEEHRIKKVHWIAETKSGTVKVEKRKLGELLQKVKKGDVIIITELSRLGRSMIMILDVLQILLEKEIKVIAIKEGYELGDNIQSKVLAFAFGLSAEIERALISERTKMGLERARKNGKQIGRPKGKARYYKLSSKDRAIKKALKQGVSINSLARKYNVTWKTMRNYINLCKKSI